MPIRYTALNSRAGHEVHNEDMEAAFDYSEEDDDLNDTHESHPLNPEPTSPLTIQVSSPNPHQPRPPRTYDFENVDYDYPPPGSPPRPSSLALPNNYGNSNGLIPSIPDGGLAPLRQSWLRRTALTVLPTQLAQRIGLGHERPQGAIGGGTSNDGVFANVTAKPSVPITVQNGDDTYVVPEDTRAEAPPSYASAQADAVPPYWETTVHAPLTPGTVGEVIVDNLPTGSLFSFLWNMLVSVSFQFVGFLLTYLLHTSHAAKLGSRAGLGVTLIQYGFALRGRLDNVNGAEQDASWGNWGQVSHPTTTDSASPYVGHAMNSTIYASTTKDLTEAQTNSFVADATTEWLSFFLMTVGWFILLTSLLGFWRVKRWERGILASQRETTPPASETRSTFPLFTRLENNFSLHGSSRLDFLRQGFGFGPRNNADDEATNAAIRAEAGANDEHAHETDAMIPAESEFNQSRSRLYRQAFERDQRLQADLRNAGFL
ncbi:hypothetical protein H0H93_000101 [Arthromyces matolae]|nr:hypothetical protein H0H93_000101 [Arthromyces matolae]